MKYLTDVLGVHFEYLELAKSYFNKNIMQFAKTFEETFLKYIPNSLTA